MGLVSGLIPGKDTLVSVRRARRIVVGCGTKERQYVCVFVRACVRVHDCD